MRKIQTFVLAIVCLIATSAIAVDPTTPTGYTPWFSVTVGGTQPDIVSLTGNASSFPEWNAITLVVAASGVLAASPPSDPSDEYLILPTGWSGNPPQDWTGPTIEKASTWKVNFAKSEGSVTGYTVYYKLRTVYSGCTKPGKPALLLQ